MSVVKIANDTLESIKQLSEEECVIEKISKLMRLAAAILLVSIFLNNELNLGIPLSKVTLNLWSKSLRDGLENNIYGICIFWAVYELIIAHVLKWGCVCLDKSEKKESIAVLFTLNDFFEFVCSLYFLVYALNELIEFNKIGTNSDIEMRVIAATYLMVEFIHWLYMKNNNKWYCIFRKYTNYFDVNNKRIPQDSNVIYHGKLYEVYWSGAWVGTNSQFKKKEWCLSSWDDHSCILLEEAVRDREGNLTLATTKYFYNTSE